MTFLQVLEATNNFSEENKLGQGGFGPVYKVREKKVVCIENTKQDRKKPSKRTSLGHVWDEREVFP
jgi:predicted Ser/Thr protein kinase